MQVIVAAVSMILYGIGVPLAFALVLATNRKGVVIWQQSFSLLRWSHSRECPSMCASVFEYVLNHAAITSDQCLRAEGMGDTAVTNPHIYVRRRCVVLSVLTLMFVQMYTPIPHGIQAALHDQCRA